MYNELKSNPKYILERLKGAQHRARIKYRIKKWIKKKLIIDMFFSGKCIGCKQINTNDNLPLLEFHHRQPDKKEIKWENISKLKLEKIENIIKNEDCICLCKNFHALIHSVHFEGFSVEIFGENSQLIDIINKKFIKLRNNINSYKFDNLIHFK